MPLVSSRIHAHRTEECFPFTHHARGRMATHGVRAGAVSAALFYGRVVHVRGADIYAIGRKEVALHARDGIDLAAHEGIQVVVAPDGHVLTVYRNRSFHGLRTGGASWRRGGARAA